MGPHAPPKEGLEEEDVREAVAEGGRQKGHRCPLGQRRSSQRYEASRHGGTGEHRCESRQAGIDIGRFGSKPAYEVVSRRERDRRTDGKEQAEPSEVLGSSTVGHE